ncbi:hypothetical protein EON63_03490 [archaeon]|nr:MAG: hypothetical protein EON63_03490 [archaeon]
MDDVVKVDVATGKVVDFIKFEVGKLAMITKGRNTGRVGKFIVTPRTSYVILYITTTTYTYHLPSSHRTHTKISPLTILLTVPHALSYN